MKDKLLKKNKPWKYKMTVIISGIIFLVMGLSGGIIMTAHKQSPPVPSAGAVGTVTSNDVWVLSKIINGEARGESYVGQVAVGAVIVNRVKNPNFPNSVWGVVFEPGAFDAVTDGQYYRTPDNNAVNAARAAINGWDPTGGALYYWNPATATSAWIWSRPIIARIGKHVFAR